MEIVSSDDHDTFDDVEEDFDEDQTHVATFIASEHVSLTEELMQTHESALKVRESNISTGCPKNRDRRSLKFASNPKTRLYKL